MAEPHREPVSAEASAQPLDALCDDILVRHHAYAHIAVPRIRGQLAALLEREPGVVPERLPAAFAGVADLLLNHLAKEENILFPALSLMAEAERTGGGRPPLAFPTVLHPIRLMEAEHARLAEGMDELARLTSDFAVPDGASDSLRRLLTELRTFGAQLSAHLQEENDILFPLALELDRRL
jgi:regulator of cell morphogenesis and NO signaling